MIQTRLRFVIALCLILCGTDFLAHSQTITPPAVGVPTMLNVTPFLREKFVTPTHTNMTFLTAVGVQEYDGLPFRIEGRGWIYGRMEAESNQKTAADYPDIIGIRVGRTFDELHLLHACRWQDGEGQPVAFVRLNYEDGTTHQWTLRYGVHLRDWQRLPSEELETLTDTNTKIVWRGVPANNLLKSTARIFKTRLDNPFPAKTVATVDILSARQVAAYDLVAATVANHDPARPVTPPAKLNGYEREFSRSTTIRVLDMAGKPLRGALIEPGFMVEDVGVIALPLYTSTNGEAVIRYPGMRTTSVSISVKLTGYLPQYRFWSAKNYGNSTLEKAVGKIALLKSFIPETNIVSMVATNAAGITPPQGLPK